MPVAAMAFLIRVMVLGWAGLAMADDPDHAGTFLAVQGTVTMQPASLTKPQPVRPYDRIGALSSIETKAASRVKMLFIDDTLVTLGEHSRLEITEQTYHPGGESRAFVAHLIRGTARVLVARSFTGENSIFEVHTRTAVVTVRGTYFIMWIEEAAGGGPAKNGKSAARPPSPAEAATDDEGATGVVNLGQTGDIAFTSGGATVLILPGQSSIALPGGPPSMPVPVDAQVTGASPVASAVARTVLSDVPRQESLRTALAEGIGDQSALVQQALMAGALGGQTSAGAYAVPGWPFPVTPVTPPAVVSGAADIPLRFSIRLP